MLRLRENTWRDGARPTALLCAGILALTGCRWLEPVEGPGASDLAEAKKAISELLGKFEKAVQEDDAEAIINLFSPVLEEIPTRQVGSEIRIAIYAWTYSDYKLYYDEALADLPLDGVQAGRIELSIEYRTGSGGIASDRFVLRRFKGKWGIGDVHMRMPQPGDSLDLPPDQRKQIIDQVALCVDALRAGDEGFGPFIMAFEERQRTATNNKGSREQYIDWMDSVQILFAGAVRGITFSRDRSHIRHDATGQVSVLVPMQVKYPPTADEPFHETILCFVLAPRGGEWQLVDLKRLKKPGFFKRLFGG